jgi:hypothetical protein
VSGPDPGGHVAGNASFFAAAGKEEERLVSLSHSGVLLQCGSHAPLVLAPAFAHDEFEGRGVTEVLLGAEAGSVPPRWRTARVADASTCSLVLSPQL